MKKINSDLFKKFINNKLTIITEITGGHCYETGNCGDMDKDTLMDNGHDMTNAECDGGCESVSQNNSNIFL